jgi:flagellar biosynthesis component FlhA
MEGQMPKRKGSAPKVELVLEISPVLKGKNALKRKISVEVARGLTELLQGLGIPGEPAVHLSSLPHEDKLLGIVVNGERCFYPDALFWRVYSYLEEKPLNRVPSAEILSWLHGSETRQIEFFALACLEIIKRQPALLLGPGQIAWYQTSLPTPSPQPKAWPPSPEWLLPVLRQVLSLKLSIADLSVVTGVLSEGSTQGRSQDEVVEDLVAALCSDVVEIQLPIDYLRQLSITDSGSEHDKFAMMRDGLFYDLGLRYPNLRFVPVDHLKSSSFACKINHLTSLPLIGLEPGWCLANDTPESLRRQGLESDMAINPANCNACSLITVQEQATAAAVGLTTWNPMEYLVLSISADLRENGACFVHRQVVQHALEQLEMAFPALVEAVQSRFAIERITQVLRALAAEEISLRNLRGILEGLLDYDYIVTDPLKLIIFDDRLPTSEQPSEPWLNHPANLTSFVRTGLKRYISHKYARGQSTLIVYLLDPALEKVLSKAHAHQTRGIRETGLSVEEQRRILDAVRAKIDTLPPSASLPAILTTVAARPVLREIIVHEFPTLPVVAFQELSPELNIQQIARISWD